ncbi:RagB/SusD family nutrient uptake outer membrane protein [Chitinophaga sp. Cy-1792]|uniref:RagB/SusD family nutrient uptake outer membrane protein n=1 Tax=Chitinophaga sp. Cy-1792 TaxID=2608339 RepID=UPI00141DD50A|nr:RagB/SusD family nutrient uptake outer membrane protein [Chitinophaga sp. Cy-1792]
MKVFKLLLLPIALMVIVSGCKKDFLNKKSNNNLIIPETLTDFDLILNDVGSAFCNFPDMGELSSDDYYIKDAIYNSLPILKTRNCYIWAPDIYQGDTQIFDWDYPYKQIFYCNIIIEGIKKITVTNNNKVQWHKILGSAYFLRAYALHNLATVFCTVYDSSTAAKIMGLPLRLSPDVNDTVLRSNLQDTYQQIISDLEAAEINLTVPFDITQPNRPGIESLYSLAARVYLYIGDYTKALKYSKACLDLKSVLLDYSVWDTTALKPFPVIPGSNNPEILYYDKFGYGSWFTILSTGLLVDTTLYNTYNSNDCRKTLFFRNLGGNDYGPKGGYLGLGNFFTGLSISETLLIYAESAARLQDLPTAKAAIIKLMQSRWKRNKNTGQSLYKIPDFNNGQDLLAYILIERRKEMVFKGTRFSDIKRLNRDSANIVLTRITNGFTYTLLPNDKKYALPIPPDEINLSGIPQNDR